MSIAREAYVADVIELDEYERALDTLRTGEGIEPSMGLQYAVYCHVQREVRFSRVDPAPLSSVRFIES
jgi:hypothetical protein